jgi:hypothetical protein
MLSITLHAESEAATHLDLVCWGQSLHMVDADDRPRAI